MKVLEADEKGRLRLSMKAMAAEDAAPAPAAEEAAPQEQLEILPGKPGKNSA